MLNRDQEFKTTWETEI